MLFHFSFIIALVVGGGEGQLSKTMAKTTRGGVWGYLDNEEWPAPQVVMRAIFEVRPDARRGCDEARAVSGGGQD
jgi:hypothetical protein